MRLIQTRNMKQGMVLGQRIYDENGRVLISSGVTLTSSMIHRLTQYGITYAYVEDKQTNDIFLPTVITDELRIKSVHTIKDIFLSLHKKGYLKQTYLLNKQETTLKNIVEQLINELQYNNEAVSLLSDIYVTDDYLFHHSLNVTIYTLAISKEMGLSDKELTEIGYGAMLHDIGKIFIDSNILQKPGKLTDEEFGAVKRHTSLGFDYLRKNTDLPTVVAHCAYQHHERIDGSGYPRGITEDEIHKYAKIIGVADVFDAVTSNRIYREAMLPHEGMEILYAGAVNLFDKSMVEAFKKSVAIYPNGLKVELSNGKSGIVKQQNKQLYDRPVVRILTKNNQQTGQSYEIDLAKAVNVTITDCDTR